MAERRLRRLRLDAAVQARLDRHGIVTAADLLRRSDLELVHLLDAPADEVAAAVAAVCAAACPRPATALELLRRDGEAAGRAGRLLVLDGVAASEARCGTITELVGAAGAGKTQCCLQLAAEAVRLGGAAVYVDTEGAFSPARLAEIAETRHPGSFGTAAAVRALMESVIVYAERTTESLLRRCQGLQAVIVERRVRLLVVDSVASPVRAGYADRAALPRRQELLSELASTLKRIARELGVAVVVTNQVTTRRVLVSDDAEDAAAEEPVQLAAALGVGWAHAVNTRLLIDVRGGGRDLRVAKSPSVPLSAHPFAIGARGVDAVAAAGPGPGARSVRQKT